jgi:itaconate CoA-transferase
MSDRKPRHDKTREEETMLPLGGVTVLSLEHAVAAPFATRQLADLGARVIKVERPGSGDFARHYDESVNGQSSYFVWINRSKESVVLDVKSPRGREILHELAERADVIVQNLGPGAAARLGLSSDEVRERDPRKIVVNITGWGSDGPWADRKAYDLLVQCETGLVSLTGTPAEVAKVGVSIADIAAGMYAFSGTLAALYRREVTGDGASIEVSLFEALAEWVGQPAHFAAGAGRQPAGSARSMPPSRRMDRSNPATGTPSCSRSRTNPSGLGFARSCCAAPMLQATRGLRPPRSGWPTAAR